MSVHTSLYKLELDRLDQWIEDNRIRRAVVQVPVGLRQLIPIIVRHLNERSVEAIVSVNSCWGGCDLDYWSVRATGADGLIHLGHARIVADEEIPTIFLECRLVDGDRLTDMVDRVAEAIGEGKTVGLGTIVQWMDHLEAFAEGLKERGITALIGSRGPRTLYRGMVVGCDYTCIWSIVDKIDCSLIIGSPFHGLGAALTTPKPVYVLDPELGKIKNMERDAESLLKCRYAWIEVFKSSRRVGVLIGVKIGQRKIATAQRIKNILEKEGKEVDLLAVDDLMEGQLDNLPYDGYVNTACPRLSIEDQTRFRVPLLLPSEALISVGKLKWKNIIYSTRYLLL